MRIPLEVGAYRWKATAESEPRPPAVVRVRITPAELARVRRLMARLRRDGAGRDAWRVRNGLARILGRETLDLVESGRRGGEAIEVRLTPKPR
jgi:hypothetical protein